MGPLTPRRQYDNADPETEIVTYPKVRTSSSINHNVNQQTYDPPRKDRVPSSSHIQQKVQIHAQMQYPIPMGNALLNNKRKNSFSHSIGSNISFLSQAQIANTNATNQRKFSEPSLVVPHQRPKFVPNLSLNQVSLMEEEIASPHDDDIQSELPNSPTFDEEEDEMYGGGMADGVSDFTKTPTGYGGSADNRFPHKDRHPPPPSEALTDLVTPDSDIYDEPPKNNMTTPIGHGYASTNGMRPPPPPMDAKRLSMDIAHDVSYAKV